MWVMGQLNRLKTAVKENKYIRVHYIQEVALFPVTFLDFLNIYSIHIMYSIKCEDGKSLKNKAK